MNITKLNDTIKSNKFLIETTFQLKKYFLNTGVTFDIEKPIQNYKQLFIFTSSIVNSLNIQDPNEL